MVNNDGDLLNRLIEEEDFKKAYDAHRDFDLRLKKLDKKISLTASEKDEIKMLKKMKLKEKDKMEAIIQRVKGARKEERDAKRQGQEGD